MLGLTVSATAGAATLTLEPFCEARVIAEFKPKLSHEQWLEVVEVSEEIGQITAEHAVQLRELIAEAYATSDVGAWVRRHCSSQSTFWDGGEPAKTAANRVASTAISQQD
jgi:hypothetical protein